MFFSSKLVLLGCFLVACFAACNPLRTTLYLLAAANPVKAVPHASLIAPDYAGCTNWKNYLPDTAHPNYLPPRQVRVNFHVMNSRDSSHNFQPAAARTYLKELLNYANIELDTNIRSWRSAETTEVLPKGYRYVIAPQPVAGDDGFYFHYDDDLYYFISQGQHSNNYSRKVIDKYAVGKDSIINIFLMVHPDDSIKSKTYRANGQGIALGTAFKMAGLYESKESAKSFDGLFNHELGHVFGLQHAWVEDGCPDTQNHPNKCWTYTDEEPCRSQATNNMMDYNAYQIALTPCQVGRVQATFASENNIARKCVIPVWCKRNPARDIIIRDSVAFTGARDFEGNITVANGGVLYLSCRVSMPENSYILVEPGGRLWLNGCRLHNSCGKNWLGVLVQSRRFVQGTVLVGKPPIIENLPIKKYSNYTHLLK
jgi:hypothetical protein